MEKNTVKNTGTEKQFLKVVETMAVVNGVKKTENINILKNLLTKNNECGMISV